MTVNRRPMTDNYNFEIRVSNFEFFQAVNHEP